MIAAPPQPALDANAWASLARLAIGCVVAAALALVVAGEPLLALAVLGLVPATLVVLRWPDILVPLAAFILYTNAAVVAVRFHGIPFLIAASYPLVLCVPIARDLVLRGQRPVVTPALPFVILFLAVQLVGALFALRPEEALAEVQSLLLEGVALYVLFTNAIRTPVVLKQVVWGLLAAGTFMAVIVLAQQLTGRFDDDFGGFAQMDNGLGFFINDALEAETRQRRMGGPLGMPNRFAQIMAMLVPLAIYQFTSARARLEKGLALAALGLILVGGSMGFSRGAAVGLVLMVVMMMLMGQVKLKHVVAMGLLGIGLIAAIVPQYAIRLASVTTVASLATQSGGPGLQNADSSTRGRVTEMVTAALVFADHPVIGVGPRMYRRHYIEYARLAGGRVRGGTRQAHNLFLAIAAENGSLGLCAFLIVLFVSVRGLLQARRRWEHTRPDLAAIATGLFFMLVVFVATSMFLHASYFRYAWFALALAGAVAQLRVPEDTRGPRDGFPPIQPH